MIKQQVVGATYQKWPTGPTNANPNKLVVATLLQLIFSCVFPSVVPPLGSPSYKTHQLIKLYKKSFTNYQLGANKDYTENLANKYITKVQSLSGKHKENYFRIREYDLHILA